MYQYLACFPLFLGILFKENNNNNLPPTEKHPQTGKLKQKELTVNYTHQIQPRVPMIAPDSPLLCSHPGLKQLFQLPSHHSHIPQTRQYL